MDKENRLINSLADFLQRKCCVIGCPSTHKSGKYISYHKFPQKNKLMKIYNELGDGYFELDVRKLWLVSLRLKQDIKISEDLMVCSLHFTSEDFCKTGCSNRKTLLPNAVPTKNLPKLDEEDSDESPLLHNGKNLHYEDLFEAVLPKRRLDIVKAAESQSSQYSDKDLKQEITDYDELSERSDLVEPVTSTSSRYSKKSYKPSSRNKQSMLQFNKTKFKMEGTDIIDNKIDQYSDKLYLQLPKDLKQEITDYDKLSERSDLVEPSVTSTSSRYSKKSYKPASRNKQSMLQFNKTKFKMEGTDIIDNNTEQDSFDQNLEHRNSSEENKLLVPDYQSIDITCYEKMRDDSGEDIIGDEKIIQCNKKYKTTSYLQNQVSPDLAQSSRNVYECKQCSQTFLHTENLQQHLKTYQTKAGLECTICQKKYKYRGSLLKHLRYVHK